MQDQPIFLTDELERQLILAEMQARFRPEPLKALASLSKRLIARLPRSRRVPLASQAA